MDEQLVNLIGASEGAVKEFDAWRLEAVQSGLNPSKIQNLKRRGLVHTRIENGVHYIVRGKRPANQPEQ